MKEEIDYVKQSQYKLKVMNSFDGDVKIPSEMLIIKIIIQYIRVYHQFDRLLINNIKLFYSNQGTSLT